MRLAQQVQRAPTVKASPSALGKGLAQVPTATKAQGERVPCGLLQKTGYPVH